MHIKRFIQLIPAALLLLTTTTGYSQATKRKSKTAPAASAVLTLDPAVRKGTLANGFTYYIRHNEKPKNRVLMYLVNKAGSILEDEDQRGLAHFMEHMSFNGTRNFPKNELVEYLQRAGIRFGADLNAYTSFDETVYQLPIPSDKPELLAGGLRIMRDWAQEATLDTGEINKERGVIMEEKRLGKGAAERLRTAYWPVIFNKSRYAERMPIGLDTVLNNFKPETIKRFYKNWYRPNLQALIIVGDINADSMERVVKQQFADLKNPLNAPARKQYTIPLTGKNQFIAVTDREAVSTSLEVLIKHIKPGLKTKSDYRGHIVRSLFNQMLGARYRELSLQADPPFINGSAGIFNFIGGLNIYDASLTAKPGELEKGFKALWRESLRVKRYGFTQTEVDRAKASYLIGVESQLREKDKTNSGAFVSEYQDHFLHDLAAPGIETEYDLAKNNIPAITLDEINRLATEYIRDTDRDIVITAPDKDKAALPKAETVLSWMQDINAEELKPYDDRVSTDDLLTTTLPPGTIVAEKEMKEVGATQIKLSNGVTVILKPTDYKNNEIIFNAFAPGGTSLSSDKDYQSAANASGIIAAGGAGNFDLVQLRKFLEGKQVGVGPFIAERFQGISGSSTPRDLETAFKLMYAYFTAPRKDSTVFKGIIQRSRAGLANRGDDPGSVFSDTVSAVLGNYSIRRTGPSLQKIDQINLDSTYSIYRQRFADASNFTFVFAGSFNTDSIRPLLQKYLGSLPATNKHEQAGNLDIHIPAGQIAKTVNKGSEQKASVILVYSGGFEYTAANRIKMSAIKEVLQMRLLTRLREEESGVYSPSVQVNSSKYPSARFSLIIQFGCAPQNVEKLIASAKDEVAKLAATGPEPESLDKWRAEEKNSFETQLRTNNFWLNYIAGQLQNNNDMSDINTYTAKVGATSAGDVKAMAARYLNGDNFVRLVLLPEK